jgi:twitching motility protein PilT
MAVLDKIFKAAVDFRASDIHIAPGEPFMIRRLGQIVKLKSQKLSAQNTWQIITEILSEDQKQLLKDKLQLDLAYEIKELGRFRGSVMMHNNGLGAVFRIIPKKIPTLQEIGMPEVVFKVLDNHQGLILVTGASGHGKSTTLAAMVDHLNTIRSHHILSIEDPIEFIHPFKKGVVNQRQHGRDTHSYSNALKGALRQDPDIIVIGELRDLGTISLAISASETGHLVIGTLATSSAPKTIDRILDSFPPGEQSQIRAMLSESLKAVITQRLLPSADRKKMELALEILVGTLSAGNLIRDNKTFQMASVMQMGKNIGMRIMDDSIVTLFQEGKISRETAVANIDNKKLIPAVSDQKNGMRMASRSENGKD